MADTPEPPESAPSASPSAADSFPTRLSILHVDADAFFASCEQALRPALKGKPVVTGKERGIASAMSYEAKAMGVTRGMRIFEVRKVCPSAVILPSDYETYSLFSVRMFDILRRFSPDVEEYSIDEAFVDLTGLRRLHRAGYGDIARNIQAVIGKELDLSVSCGVAPTKVLAKIGSKFVKPRGLTVISSTEIPAFISKISAGKVWGIGPNTAALMLKLGIETARDFARKDDAFVKKYFSKPYHIIWNELNGRSVLRVETEPKTRYQSISKARTFTPPSADDAFVYGQLCKNLENACIKARRYKLAATRLAIFLRAQDFKQSGVEAKLDRPTACPADLFGALRKGFEDVFRSGTLYRQTGVVLAGLAPEQPAQSTLFDDPARVERLARLYECVDRIADRFGKHTVHHLASMPAHSRPLHAAKTGRGEIPRRRMDQFKGETARRRIGLPVMNITLRP